MTASRTDRDEPLRGLYQGSLSDFVARRQALARELRANGDARAAAVAKLVKPALSAWAVNRLFAREAGAMEALIGAGETARAGARKGGNARVVRDALDTIEAQVRRLVERGVAALLEVGGASGAAIVERLRTNLEALALDPGSAEIAARAWLDADLPAVGFEVLAPLQLAAAGGKAPESKARGGATVHRFEAGRQAAAARKQGERRERLDALRQDVARADAAETSAKREVERTEEDAAAAERRAAEARRTAKAAAQRLSAATDTLRRARGELERAEKG